jgi:hypothetical protein
VIESHTRTIGRYAYTVTQLRAKQGNAVLVRLAKLAGPTLGALFSGGEEGAGEALERVSLGGLGAALREFAAGLTEADLDWLCTTFADCTTVEIEPGSVKPLRGIFDLHFAGAYLELFEWIAFCLEVNFADFFGALVARAKAAKAPRTTPAPTR